MTLLDLKLEGVLRSTELYEKRLKEGYSFLTSKRCEICGKVVVGCPIEDGCNAERYCKTHLFLKGENDGRLCVFDP